MVAISVVIFRCLQLSFNCNSYPLHTYDNWMSYGPLARNLRLRVALASGMPGKFSPPPRKSDLDMHHGTCVTHVPWCISGSLSSGFLWSRWRVRRSRHSRRMRNPQFYVSGKRPMQWGVHSTTKWKTASFIKCDARMACLRCFSPTYTACLV